jgi:hypothetical protein
VVITRQMNERLDRVHFDELGLQLRKKKLAMSSYGSIYLIFWWNREKMNGMINRRNWISLLPFPACWLVVLAGRRN